MKKQMNRRRFFQITTVSIGGLLAACGEGPGNPSTADSFSPDLEQLDAGSDSSFEDQPPTGDGVLPDSVAKPDVVDTTPTPNIVDPSTLPEDGIMFHLGVQSGDVLPDSAILWTRFSGTLPLDLIVWVPSAAGSLEGALFASIPINPDPSGFATANLVNLDPYTDYAFCFRALESLGGEPSLRSAVGRFRTAPLSDELLEVTVGGTSCTNENYKPFPVLSQAANDNLDLFILGGDTVYADGATSLGDYRAFWEGSLGSKGYLDLTQSVSTVSSWDDHEVDNNWDPEEIGTDHLNNARQTFFEHLPIRRSEDDPDRIWRSVRWGRTLEVFVLDCRGERKPSTRNSDDAEYISPAQFDWLVSSIQNSDAVFKMIVNSVPITNMPPFYVSENDRWEGYPKQREALLSAIGSVSGVFFVSGDFHFGGVFKVDPPAGPYHHVPEILMGPGGQFPNPAWFLLDTVFYEEQFPFLTGENNYTRMHFNPNVSPPLLTVDFINGAGTVFHTSTLTF